MMIRTKSRACAALAWLVVLSVPFAAQKLVRKHDGDAPNDQYGWSASGVGDLDLDGHGEYAGGSLQGGPAGGGYVHVYSGATGDVLFTVYGEPDSGMGADVSPAGDVDGDGWPDVVVGAYKSSAAAGYAEVYSGLDGHFLRRFPSDGGSDGFGGSVSDAGDVDGDGFDDVFLGGGPYARVVSVLDGRVLLPFADEAVGPALSRAGDVDGDGVGDFVVGNPGHDGAAGLDAGIVRVYSGTDGGVIWTFEGTSERAELGTSVGWLGDVDGDGRADVLAGAEREVHGGVKSGGVHVYSGADGTELWSVYGDLAADLFGHAVDGLGDVDGDGVPDWVVGAPTTGTGPGYVRVFSGRDGSASTTFANGAFARFYGQDASWAGDVDADGHPDILVGHRLNGPLAGKIEVRSAALFAEAHSASVSAGSLTTHHLDAGAKERFRAYRLVGSASGTFPGYDLKEPGTYLNTVLLPLNADVYTQVTLQFGGTPFFSGFVGQLDVNGRGTAQLWLPPTSAPGLVGLTLRHAFVVFETLPGESAVDYTFASNASALSLLP